MRTVIVADKNDRKLSSKSYSLTYQDMLRAFLKKIEKEEGESWVIYDSCSAKDIEADVVIFWDLHSTHDIEIEGIENHKAVKLSMFNDPHQEEFVGKYGDGTPVHKLGRKQRLERARNRGVSHIWCPYESGFYRWLGDLTRERWGDRWPLLWHFPVAPSEERFRKADVPLEFRKKEILANGATWAGGLNCYDFRRWAFNRPQVSFVEHTIRDQETPCGDGYGDFISQYAGILALCDWYVVPKCFEGALAGCVLFVQESSEIKELGFINGVNCEFVSYDNFDENTKHFLKYADGKEDPDKLFQKMAKTGQELVRQKYTAEKFADWLYDKCKIDIGE